MASRLKNWIQQRVCRRNVNKNGDGEITTREERSERTPLPKANIGIIFVIMLFNAMTMTMVFSYLPNFVKSFGTSEVKTGYYAGLIASSLFFSRIFSSLVWGYVVDNKGKKFSLITSTAGLAVATLAFGFSTNFWWALITRFFQGSFMGLIVAAKSMLTDLCDDTNIAFGLSVVLSSFSAGLIIGPSCAGFLVFPNEQYPSLFSPDNIFSKFGILLPNFLLFIGFVISLMIGVKLLPNDRLKPQTDEQNYLLDPKNNTKRYDNVFEEYELNSFKRKNPETYLTVSLKKSTVKVNNNTSIHYFQFIEPIVGTPSSEMTNQRKPTMNEKWQKSQMKELFSKKWCVVSCSLYGMYSVVAIGIDELVPLFLATSSDYYGLNFSTGEIGTALLIVSVPLFFLQITIVTFVTAKYGSRKVFIVSLLILSFILPLLPSITAIENKTWMWVVLCVYLLVARVAIASAFLALNILVNNSVETNLIGKANGLAMTLSSAGRMIAPTMVGTLYSWSLTNIKGVEGNEKPMGFPFNQYFPFFVLSTVSIVNAVFASKIPSSLDTKINEEVPDPDDVIVDDGDNNESGVDTISGNVTNITVGYFTPTSPKNTKDKL